MVLQDHRRLLVCIFRVKIAAVGSLKRVTERIFKNSVSKKVRKVSGEVHFYLNNILQCNFKSLSNYRYNHARGTYIEVDSVPDPNPAGSVIGNLRKKTTIIIVILLKTKMPAKS
jgi:hypothetical protein